MDTRVIPFTTDVLCHLVKEVKRERRWLDTTILTKMCLFPDISCFGYLCADEEIDNSGGSCEYVAKQLTIHLTSPTFLSLTKARCSVL